MLQFILGRAAAGKTYETVSRAAQYAKAGKNPVILVPEQFSFECEKQVLSALGEKLAQSVKVLSFSRLCDEVNRVTGGVCRVQLKDADRLIIMKKAVKTVADGLTVFSKYASSNGFAKKMNETVQELKLNAVSSDFLLSAAESLGECSLSSKLSDISKIMNAYDMLLTERFIDPADRLSVLYEKLEGYRYFEDKCVFIDSFDGFTGQQYRILDRIFSQSKEIFVALNFSDEADSEYGIFAGTAKLKNRLEKMADAHNLKKSDDIILEKSHYESAGLFAAEKYLFDGTADENADASGISVCEAETVYDEAEFVARSIRKIVRENGSRYSNFLVVARDTAPYTAALSSAMQKNGIPLFCDQRTSLSSTPVAAAVIAAAELIKSINSERIFRLYKSGISVFTPEELGTLENYVYIWNIDGKAWLKEWDMNPRGFERGEADKQKLAEINDLRERAVKPILKLTDRKNETAKDMVGAVMSFFDSVNAPKRFALLAKAYKESGDVAFADTVRQSYDAVISVFDSIVSCYNDERITPAEFCDALGSAFSLETLGNIPQSLDGVTFGAADRIRPARPDYVFILGANQGVFPKNTENSGVFSAADRSRLIELGIDIPDKSIYDAINEDYLVYTNVCSAKKELYISFSTTLIDGGEGESSAFLADMCSAFNIKIKKEPGELCSDNLPETEDGALSDFCRRYTNDRASSEKIFCAMGEKSVQRAESLKNFSGRPIFTLKPENAAKLFGKTLRMSPSKFDNFSRCRFMYFCKNVLGIDTLQKSELNNLQRGTVVHYVLERIVDTYGKALVNLSDEEISARVSDFTDEYLDAVNGYRNVEDSRLRYMISEIKHNLSLVVCHMADEFRNSDFEPVGCEVGIGLGDKDGIPEIKIPLDNGNEIALTGSIDRLDSYNGYIRVVDYKTGSRKFKLPDILLGQNMQMLIYLYAVSKDEKLGGEPAGIFYMPAKMSKNSEARDCRMNGLLIRNEDVNLAMDRSESGKFIPKDDRWNKDTYIEEGRFEDIFRFTDRFLKASGNAIYDGKIYANPADGLDSPACKYCPFGCVCRIEDKDIKKTEKIPNEDVFSKMEGWEDNENQADR